MTRVCAQEPLIYGLVGRLFSLHILCTEDTWNGSWELITASEYFVNALESDDLFWILHFHMQQSLKHWRKMLWIDSNTRRCIKDKSIEKCGSTASNKRIAIGTAIDPVPTPPVCHYALWWKQHVWSWDKVPRWCWDKRIKLFREKLKVNKECKTPCNYLTSKFNAICLNTFVEWMLN